MRTRLHTVELNEVKLIDVLYDYFEAVKAAGASGAAGTVAEGKDFYCIHSDPSNICKKHCGELLCLPGCGEVL